VVWQAAPLPRIDDVRVHGVLCCVCRASDYVNGITLPVDGGWLGR
jgi:NAD(P)-dependent dehydrogenase (short-subunit alcohol dehydrogenase family)